MMHMGGFRSKNFQKVDHHNHQPDATESSDLQNSERIVAGKSRQMEDELAQHNAAKSTRGRRTSVLSPSMGRSDSDCLYAMLSAIGRRCPAAAEHRRDPRRRSGLFRFGLLWRGD